ncbi:alkylation response protein AidB-like acyl-CoA dehydrogenase [Actinocorallia herbida]|uniref:Alkylation response protein AidB-like acyl-CoA dehydrogenase n=1 Tax=Actinocorallia herbida TaxID=58109 RepID=A0A3N1D8Z6_9ACTN|nr:acyl-CoA dehydrogenase family protein [Actinocorallia herbida]ROO90013.1 alkylation response protein AidB-like acyl-CoA dehydrogenase [Actinocorallia herbida]
MSDELLSQDEVRAALRGYFADTGGLDEARRLRDAPADDPGYDAGRWKALAGDVGLVSMAAPEGAGGLGLGLVHLTAAAEEAGAVLYAGPLRASVLAAWALGSAEADFDGVLTGAETVAMPQGFAALQPGLVLDGDGLVGGSVPDAAHGMTADVLLAIADTAQGPCAVLVRLGEEGVTRTPVAATDLTARPAALRLDGVPAVRLTAPGDRAALGRVGDAARLLLAAEQVGGAQGCLDHTVAYARIRTQFDQVIGTYQAIQHRCAETAIAVSAARALVFTAAVALDAGAADEAHRLVLLAKAEASDAFEGAAATLIQVNGGIGFTWEHDAHLYYRRAKATAAYDGRPSRLRDEAVASGALALLTR